MTVIFEVVRVADGFRADARTSRRDAEAVARSLEARNGEAYFVRRATTEPPGRYAE